MERFCRQGFDGTTVEEIAEACEVSPRTFFRYFPTKEDVLFADAEARRARLLAVIAERPVDEPAFGALQAAMRTLAADYRDDRDALVARSKVVAASPHLQVYKAEHQHGWEAGVVEVLERRALAQRATVAQRRAAARHRGHDGRAARRARRLGGRPDGARPRRAPRRPRSPRLAVGFEPDRVG